MAESETVGQRFTQLIAHLGISKNAFAASLDKTATVIQHLVDERNKPGFDLLRKVFEVYPNVSKDWLLQGEGPMLTDESKNSASVQEARLTSAAKAAPPTAVTIAPVPSTEAAQELKPKAAPQPDQVQAAPPAAKPAAEAPPVVSEPVTPMPIQPVSQAAVASPTAEAAPTTVAATSDTSWQTALYTQQMAHQLAMAELRNQHLQEQQRLMQQMMDLMQRQLVR
ncbi:helix-turn-helix transcriptional regulator [Hymenobacter volaticus]|uniref:XRE family transcriptional regulator n=1 Tax=Hymenobacter volaticus TaxID=2932254 RepID=A0ABY4G1H3_9BACT|nr:helix-turn-helix transcriptional regulator [Hymenobacter volaticus]UOQ64434.1 hypothetical protein MUN86_12620 [Hymenobacter volaticus]